MNCETLWKKEKMQVTNSFESSGLNFAICTVLESCERKVTDSVVWISNLIMAQ